MEYPIMAAATQRRKPSKSTKPKAEASENGKADEDLVFVEEPPTPRRGRDSKWDPLLAKLREHPGEWARLPGHHNSGVASMIRAGKTKGSKPNEFEVVTRTIVEGLDAPPKNHAYIYVRFVGDEDAPVEQAEETTED